MIAWLITNDLKHEQFKNPNSEVYGLFDEPDECLGQHYFRMGVDDTELPEHQERELKAGIAAKKGYEFILYDDDSIPYYKGRAYALTEDELYDGVDEILAWGARYAGCTILKFPHGPKSKYPGVSRLDCS